MSELSPEQLLYLLYAVAYSVEGTVTKGAVKGYLSKSFKKDANNIYDVLSKQELIESSKKGRLFVTKQGKKALIANLKTTTYQFDSPKGSKVLNTLLYLLKEASSNVQTTTALFKDIDFETFVEKFKALYFEERKRQELHGVVAIHSRDICQSFMEDNPISQLNLDNYFNRLKSTGKVFAVTEKDDELIQWVE